MSLPEYPSRSRPFVRIVEQPSKSLRYRYLCEGRPGTIPGVSSTPEHKIPFTVEIVGYQGRVVVVVSCVTQKPPYKPHPHSLSGPHCKDGYCTLRTEVTAENSRISFPKLAVQCVKKKEVEGALKVRQQKNIDPFLTGFEHSSDVRSIDLNVVRLCVQVFLRGEGKDLGVLSPVVSEPIYNKKTLPDPLIYRLSQCNCCVNGKVNGKEEEEIILLCTRVSKEDIKIRFFEIQNSIVVWEDYGTFKSNGVYNHTAICFKPPRYYNQDINEPSKVYLQLVRISDEVVSPPIEFEYLPLDAEPGALAKKRKKNDGNLFFHKLVQPNAESTSKSYIDLDKFVPRPNSNLQLSFSRYSSSTSRDTTPSSATCDTTPSPLNYFPKETIPCSVSNYDYFVSNPTEEQTIPLSPLTSFLNDIDVMARKETTLNCDFSVSPLTSFLNNIDATAGTSRQTDATYNIISSGDFAVSSPVNIENANAVREILPSCQENELPVIHLSSGDLEMRSVERLSESFQESLVM